MVSIDGYKDVERTESALLCATVKQPISAGMDGSAEDFQLYTSVSSTSHTHINQLNKNHRMILIKWTVYTPSSFTL